ncbi:hypothetical protein [Burkholderia latens]|uniref:hypothetical protein n=1 Tax=Burkholderia latens TaxID=488446 RepID=UPI001AE178B5|nr:hypothetical protein [Burkholderia latens]QTO45598.1 hypothetical protein J8I85_24520 [Burkholderia latens]
MFAGAGRRPFGGERGQRLPGGRGIAVNPSLGAHVVTRGDEMCDERIARERAEFARIASTRPAARSIAVRISLLRLGGGRLARSQTPGACVVAFGPDAHPLYFPLTNVHVRAVPRGAVLTVPEHGARASTPDREHPRTKLAPSLPRTASACGRDDRALGAKRGQF